MKSEPLATPRSPAIPVADLLRRMGRELRDLAGSLETLQVLVGRLVADGALRDADMMRQLQQFDRLEQGLGAIAGFALALGEDVPGHWLVDPQAAARAVFLSELAARLLDAAAAPAASDRAAAGELELL